MINQEIKKYILTEFSHENFCNDVERKKIEDKFSKKLEILKNIDRKSVSFQLSKNNGPHGWLKYREGFSSELVSFLLEKMNLNENSIILDPFFGSGTTGFACQEKNIASFGLDVLPTSALVTEAKNNIYLYDVSELEIAANIIDSFDPNIQYNEQINFIPITQHAYEIKIDNQLAYLKKWINENNYSQHTKNIINLVILNSLEELSYTTKDGQYLRWDYRSEKVKIANKKRIENKKPPIKTILDKGTLPETFKFISNRLSLVIEDIKTLQKGNKTENLIKFKQDSALNFLPSIPNDYFNGVITSPPYCNRYDYTRTYALELAYLDYNNTDIKNLRQSLLTCTVENKDKRDILFNKYSSIGKIDTFHHVENIIKNNLAFNEIIESLNIRADNNYLNNKGVIRMVYGYFYELTFIYYEILRTCKPDSKIYFVNDNVRYGGEVIPVDFLSCQIAEDLGFKVNRIYSIEQQKGNSSQQMKKFGRVPLRKSITEWIVPNKSGHFLKKLL